MKQLEQVQIADQASKFPGQLSGGQQQRAACKSFMHGAKNYAF